MVLTVPTMLLAMLERYASAPRDLSSLRTVMSGGAKVADTLVRRTTQTFGCEFSILFGQAELHGAQAGYLLAEQAGRAQALQLCGQQRDAVDHGGVDDLPTARCAGLE